MDPRGEWIDFRAAKEAVGIERLLDGYGVKLRRRVGAHLRGRCPLPQHSSWESGESFIVSTHKNVWICHSQSCVAARGGQAGGNVLDLVAVMENCSIADAARRLSVRFGTGGRMRRSLEDTGFKKNEAGSCSLLSVSSGTPNAPLRFVLCPLDSRHPYLQQRGIERQTAEYFQVGFYSTTGLLEGRVAIPVHNRQGQLVAYAGRVIEQTEPRYRFPPGFQKSLELFNLHRALRSGARQVVVVEGFFDCMNLHQAGFSGVVALMGSALSEAQQKLLLDHFGELVLMMDGDETGRRASRRIAAQLGARIPVRLVEVPAGRQPDQLNAPEIRRLLENSGMPLQMGAEPNAPDRRTAMVERGL
jgi:DNA primase